MLTKDLTVTNEMGVHARPASTIVQVAGKFKSEITFIKDDIRANAKSILNILLLAAEMGAVISVEVEGEDEQEAMMAIETLFENKFKNDD